MLVAGRYNGPPTSGNGGYTAGLLATTVGPGTRTVTLRRPPPLDVEMTVDGQGVLRAGEEIVAVAEDAVIRPEAPAWGDPRTAEAYAGFTDHPFPTCYVCGPERPDGLRIFPGRLADGRTAAQWRVPDSLDDVTIWAALDCPGGWAVIGPGGPHVSAPTVIAGGSPSARQHSRPYVLGRITVAVDALPEPGEDCVIVGECTGTQGRKGFVRSALYAADRRVLAASEAVWISV